MLRGSTIDGVLTTVRIDRLNYGPVIRLRALDGDVLVDHVFEHRFRGELALWAVAFEILCEQATHIVAVIEDYEGGYVWELGYLFREELREKVWVLKRDYGSAGANRERYDNGMAASHVRLLENADRTVRWSDEAELRDGTNAVP